MEAKSKLIAKMNDLLANYQIHYQNLRGLHWNIKGEQFFELHVKYEELYTRAQVIIDELAERILSIGGAPVHQYAKYLERTNIQELSTITNGAEGVAYIVDAQETILKLERELLLLTDELADEGSNALMSDLIREKEKTTWMFNAWLNKK
ncbi:MAG: DNA starvation/stationary phase protection protein [Crocinitomicaceae bacterium]|nr:DNA starvation/stationary phase protection protein [Crocinitomicaceae bacterium]